MNPPQVAPYRPRRRVIVELTPQELTEALELVEAHVIDVRVDHMRDTIRILVDDPTADEVAPYAEPPVVTLAQVQA